MNERRNSRFLYGGTVAILIGLIGLPVSAERILYLDASAPGEMSDTEGTFWLDHTASEYDLIATGDPAPVHYDNANGMYWKFDPNNGFKGIGDHNVLNFETDVEAGPGLGDPFTLNAYLKFRGATRGDVPYVILTKADIKPGADPGAGWARPAGRGGFSGYAMMLTWDQTNSSSLTMKGGNSANRHFLRSTDEVGGSLENRDVMITVTHDGSGSTAGTQIYMNGNAAENLPWPVMDLLTGEDFVLNEDSLEGSTLNTDQLEIGANDDFGTGTAHPGNPADNNNGMNADVYFIEIYDHALTGEEVVSRYNGGEPERATVNPIRSSDSGFSVSSLTPVTVLGVEFLSEVGKTYELQAKDSETDWERVLGGGTSIAGTGGTLILSDPGGYDSNKTYRVFTSF